MACLLLYAIFKLLIHLFTWKSNSAERHMMNWKTPTFSFILAAFFFGQWWLFLAAGQGWKSDYCFKTKYVPIKLTNHMNYSSHAFLTTAIAFVLHSLLSGSCIVSTYWKACPWQRTPLVYLCQLPCSLSVFAPSKHIDIVFWQTLCAPDITFSAELQPTSHSAPWWWCLWAPPGKCRHTHLPLGISVALIPPIAPSFPVSAPWFGPWFWVCLSITACRLV